MTGQITIKNKTKNLTEIDIEGVIGVPEEHQFEPGDTKIATYQKFKDALLEMRDIKTAKIVINIRSIGGNVCDALLIHDTLVALKADVTTRCFGYVASAATIIAQTASPGKRLISQNSLYLIHKSTSSVEGNSTEIAQTIGLLDKTDQRIAEIYARRAAKNYQNFAALMSENNGNGRWLTPQECIEAGLADRMISPRDISNDMNNMAKIMNFPKLPEPAVNHEANTIMQAWSMIRKILDLTSQPEKGLSKEKLETIDREIQQREQQIMQNQHEIEKEKPKLDIEPVAETHNPDEERLELQNKILELEAQNAKLKAAKTATIAKEDPAPQATEISERSNKTAYIQDLSNLMDR